MDNKYKMFKNYMMNELGISREDIQGWIKEMLAAEVEKYVRSTYEKVSIETEIQRIVKKLLTDNFWNETRFKEAVYKEILDEIIKTYDIRFVEKK